MASLSALAQQTAQSFPEIDDLGEFQGEEGDRTILRPAGAGPALPESDDPREQTNGITEHTREQISESLPRLRRRTTHRADFEDKWMSTGTPPS